MSKSALLMCLVLVSVVAGCALQEVRSKSTVGPEFRHQGSNNTDSVRWYVQQGVEFKWDQGITTALTYRRRDVDQGLGGNDNGVWFEFGFPIWKAPKKPDLLARRVEVLARRLAELERRNGEHTEENDEGT